MDSQNFTSTFTVDQSPEEVFAAIVDVPRWWTGDVEGSTDTLGDEFTYRYPGAHYSKQKIAELIPGQEGRLARRRRPPRGPGGPERVDGDGDQLRDHPDGRWDRGPLLAPRSGARFRVFRRLFERMGLLRQRKPQAPDHDG